MNKLAYYRKQANLTQKKLAELSDVKSRSIQLYEQGKMDINKAEAMKLYRIAKVLSCTIEDLLEL